MECDVQLCPCRPAFFFGHGSGRMTGLSEPRRSALLGHSHSFEHGWNISTALTAHANAFSVIVTFLALACRCSLAMTRGDCRGRSLIAHSLAMTPHTSLRGGTGAPTKQSLVRLLQWWYWRLPRLLRGLAMTKEVSQRQLFIVSRRF